jgi:hypothetical protein
MDWKRLLCKLGFHVWSKPRVTYLSGSNVKDFTKYCKRCGKQKRWVETV